MPLNDIGRRQADEAGRLLGNLVADGARLKSLASPLVRARETMERLRAAMGLAAADYCADDRLKEIAFGIFEGRTWKELRRQDPGAYAARERDRWAYAPQGGESYAMLAERIAPVLAALDGDTLIVSHGGVARALLTLLCGLARRDALPLAIWQGRILVVRDRAFEWTPAAQALQPHG